MERLWFEDLRPGKETAYGDTHKGRDTTSSARGNTTAEGMQLKKVYKWLCSLHLLKVLLHCIQVLYV